MIRTLAIAASKDASVLACAHRSSSHRVHRLMSSSSSSPPSSTSSSAPPTSSSSSSSSVSPSADAPPAPIPFKSRFEGAYTPVWGSECEPHRAPVSHAGAPLNEYTKSLKGQVFSKSPMEYISAVPVIEVEGWTAICDGGDPRLGHPISYIQLNKIDSTAPATCKWCGLRYIHKKGSKSKRH